MTKRFRHRTRGELLAVRDVTLDVAPGQFLTLLGPSGCGKTTTLRMIAGFEQPTAGRILIGETDVTSRPASERNLGMVFQSYALFPHLSVFENVAYGLRVRKRSAAEIARAVGEVLALVGLAGHERQAPHQLSGGEQQRVALARAVVIRPQVLLFDEPLSNLDARLRVQMRDEIRRLQKALSITAVYVTHDQEEAMAIADRIVVMERGRLVQAGSAEDLYARPATAFVAGFIGRSTIVPAIVRDVTGETASVDVAGAVTRAGWAGAAPEPGATVRLALRPETLALGRPGGGGLPGVVTERTFLGEKVDYLVACGALTFQVSAWDPARRAGFGPGDAVEVALPGDGARILADEAAG
ncbi:MAG: ABC transporter ATP-binding protein [Candidatus Rokubacteria bacterium]|nr:ABC transporter ATP-binding protein [Candidatus Rokubacteria bacterium]